MSNKSEVIAMGQRLQELRQEAGLSQTELAEAAHVPIGSLRNWEQGRRLPQLDAAFRLSKALGITLDTFAGKVFEAAPEPTKPARKRKPKSE